MKHPLAPLLEDEPESIQPYFTEGKLTHLLHAFALGDAWVAIAAYMVSFVVLMIPMGWYMVNEQGWDERGMALAIAISCTLATILLCWRFRVLTRVH